LHWVVQAEASLLSSVLVNSGRQAVALASGYLTPFDTSPSQQVTTLFHSPDHHTALCLCLWVLKIRILFIFLNQDPQVILILFHVILFHYFIFILFLGSIDLSACFPQGFH
jgi:hypothetical protein